MGGDDFIAKVLSTIVQLFTNFFLPLYTSSLSVYHFIVFFFFSGGKYTTVF